MARGALDGFGVSIGAGGGAMVVTFMLLVASQMWLRKSEEEASTKAVEGADETSSPVSERSERPTTGASGDTHVEAAAHEARPIRIWMDGAYDVMHYGHVNAFRQGRALGHYLIVGVNDSESITRCKGTAPLMSDDERIAAVEACRFVDEIVREVPYVMTEKYLASIIEKYKIDLVVHGDDPCIVDGRDVYATAKARGMYREIARTEGVSTTDIIGRLLSVGCDGPESVIEAPCRRSPFTTSSMFQAFSVPGPRQVRAAPKEGARVVYVDGAWDLFHAGHVAVLRQAKTYGDYVIVGVHDDAEVNRVWGAAFPIMNMQERALSVLGCKFVDDVLMGPPVAITKEMLVTLRIDVVLRFPEDSADGRPRSMSTVSETDLRYEIPEAMGILRDYRSGYDLSVRQIAQRVRAEAESLKERFHRKTSLERELTERKVAEMGY